jgi:hypothetical protein
MDREFMIDYFKEQFGLADVEVNFVVRGTKYPVENLA